MIIYNHQYKENIERLEQLYRSRFGSIFHLVPFYRGSRSNVIPVYENSRYFQGYIAQAFRAFFREEFSHYIFLADDLILNPVINEGNYQEHFALRAESCFLPNVVNLHEVDTLWPRVSEAFHYRLGRPGIEAHAYLPTVEEALKIFQSFRLRFEPLKYERIWGSPFPLRKVSLEKLRAVCHFLKHRRKAFRLPYPLVGGYADICVVSARSIHKFSQYCGVTAATRLFVELGLPTSVLLSAEDLVTETDLALKGRALWSKEDLEFLGQYEGAIAKLLGEFPADHLYLHPVKLSKWK